MRKAQKDPQGWLTNLVETMIDQLGVRKWSKVYAPQSNQISWRFSGLIRMELAKMSPAKRGEIADLGGQGLNSPSCGRYINHRGSGREIVTDVALATIIIYMENILNGESLASRGLSPMDLFRSTPPPRCDKG